MDGDGWREILIIVVTGVVIALSGLAQALIGITSRQRLRTLSGVPEVVTHGRTVHSVIDPRRVLFSSMVIIQISAA
ncbi:MAG: hypothetical protein ACR2OE_03065, partial [Thermomicrobiales bacterium]